MAYNKEELMNLPVDEKLELVRHYGIALMMTCCQDTRKNRFC